MWLLPWKYKLAALLGGIVRHFTYYPIAQLIMRIFSFFETEDTLRINFKQKIMQVYIFAVLKQQSSLLYKLIRVQKLYRGFCWGNHAVFRIFLWCVNKEIIKKIYFNKVFSSFSSNLKDFTLTSVPSSL